VTPATTPITETTLGAPAPAAAPQKSALVEAPVTPRAAADRGDVKRRHARLHDERPRAPQAHTALEKPPADAAVAPVAPDAPGVALPLTKIPTSTRESKMGSLIDRL
jgi:hypothetical protein